MSTSKLIDKENEQDSNTETLGVTDEFLLTRRIVDLQSNFNAAFKNLKFHLGSAYLIDYSYVFAIKDIDTNDLAEFASYVDSKVDAVLNKRRLKKAQIISASTFKLKPADLEINESMLIEDFTDIDFVDKTYGISFVHTLADFQSNVIVENLVMLIARGCITLQEIEQELALLEEFIRKVKDTSDSFDEFRSELTKINENLVNEYKSSYCR